MIEEWEGMEWEMKSEVAGDAIPMPRDADLIRR